MRGLVPQDGLFGGSGTAGLESERGLDEAAHSAVAGSLLTLPSPTRCSSTDVARRPRSWGPRSTAPAPGARRGATWSARSAARMTVVAPPHGPGEPLVGEDRG